MKIMFKKRLMLINIITKIISDEKLALLNKMYRRLTQKDTAKFNEREDDRTFKRRQRKLYRAKRKN